MKASVLALLLAAPLAAANFNAVFALLKSLGLTKQFECAIPCLLEATNKIPCEGKGAVNLICDNVDRIAEDTRPCTEKCKAKRGNDFVVELTKYVCGLGQPQSAETVEVKEEL